MKDVSQPENRFSFDTLNLQCGTALLIENKGISFLIGLKIFITAQAKTCLAGIKSRQVHKG